ncbi:MAG: redoxin domain-containing protein [Candidatus Pacearchaeota archaeon]
MNKKYAILAIVIVCIFVAIAYLESQKSASISSDSGVSEFVDSSKPVVKEIEGVEYPLSAELAGISGYINTNDKEIKIADYSGKVVLIDFWTYTCINCIRTLPYLTAWDSKYRDKGLVIIGVHAPEFEFEKVKENVILANEKYGIEYPVVQDNDRGTWAAFNNRYWPAKYLIDSEGYIRYTHFGEGNYEETELQIQKLLAEAGEDASGVSLTEETNSARYKTTPELYAGAVFALPRGQYIGNKKTPVRQEEYTLPIKLDKRDVIYLEGLWTHNSDNLQLDGDSGTIALDFTASEVNIVAAPLDGAGEVIMEVLIDGKYATTSNAGEDVVFSDGKAFVKVDEKRLYEIFKGSYGENRLDLKVSEGFSFNAFTFG